MSEGGCQTQDPSQQLLLVLQVDDRPQGPVLHLLLVLEAHGCQPEGELHHFLVLDDEGWSGQKPLPFPRSLQAS